MSVSLIILATIIGLSIAYILNWFIGAKIENKIQRIGLKIAAYIVCIILCLGFAFIGSLHTILDKFITDRIKTIEITFTEMFPDLNILETEIDINEFIPISNDLQQIINTVDRSHDSFIEKTIYNAFIKRLADYVYTVKNGMDTIVMMGDDNGLITINSILYNLKDMLINTVSPYFVYGQMGIFLLLLVFIGIYIGIVIFIKKGGAMYNKSIVFGDIKYDDSREKRQNRE